MSVGESAGLPLRPTANLRFVDRVVPIDSVDGPASPPVRRILQQWWAEDMPAYMRNVARGEWRDIPLVSET
jgi:hypothetical protein